MPGTGVPVGYRADLAIWDISGIEAAGNWDPATLLLAGPTRVRDLLVEGRRVVADGQTAKIELPRVWSVRQHWPRSWSGESKLSLMRYY